MMVNFTYINETLKTLGKECNVSFKPSHSFTCPFAYCSAAHRNVSFIRLILFLSPFRMPSEADSLKWFTLKIRGKEF